MQKPKFNPTNLLQVGFNNFVSRDNIIAILDYSIPAVKKILTSAKKEKPRNVLDVTRHKGTASVIVLTGDRYVLSNIPRLILAKRIGLEENPTRDE